MNQVVQLRQHPPVPLPSLPELLRALAAVGEVELPGALGERRLQKALNPGHLPRRSCPPPARPRRR